MLALLGVELLACRIARGVSIVESGVVSVVQLREWSN